MTAHGSIEAQQFHAEPGLRRRSEEEDRSVTMIDVARRAGVSPMTVSRVINGREGVSAAVRAYVQSIIAEVDYSPNLAARALSINRQRRGV